MSGAARRVAGVACVVVLLGASPAQAWIVDPVERGLLAKVSAILQAIEEFRMRVMDRIQEEIDSRINAYAFPIRLFQPIRATATAVLDMRRELQQMACAWPMSLRTQSLSNLFSHRLQLCRSGYQGVWGSHEAFWDGPIQEANDYIATMTANMMSERTEKTNTSWVQAHKDLFDQHTILRNSPGEANRAEAAALAWANEVAIGNSQMATQHLLVRQMDRALERFDDKKAADLTYYTYRGLTTLAGEKWTGAPPDPSQELLQ
jgi:hypothetical protein